MMNMVIEKILIHLLLSKVNIIKLGPLERGGRIGLIRKNGKIFNCEYLTASRLSEKARSEKRRYEYTKCGMNIFDGLTPYAYVFVLFCTVNYSYRTVVHLLSGKIKGCEYIDNKFIDASSPAIEIVKRGRL